MKGRDIPTQLALSPGENSMYSSGSSAMSRVAAASANSRCTRGCWRWSTRIARPRYSRRQARELIPVRTTRRRAGVVSSISPPNSAQPHVLALRIVPHPRHSVHQPVDAPGGAGPREVLVLRVHPAPQRRLDGRAVPRQGTLKAQVTVGGKEDREGQPGVPLGPRAGRPVQDQHVRYRDVHVPAEASAHPVVDRVPARLAGGQRLQYPAFQPGPERELIRPPVQEVVSVHDLDPAPLPLQRRRQPPGEQGLAGSGRPVDGDQPDRAQPRGSAADLGGQVREALDRHSGAPGGRKGSAGGGPDSMSRQSASVSRCSSTRSPSRSSRLSRRCAKQVSGATWNPSRPASRAASVRKARRYPSDSKVPCQWVPKTLPYRAPSPGSMSGSALLAATYP